ncbi:hypothetical protein [Mycolicibacterium sphagni]|uniref:Uncharacterized protein n=1 Tax=Mycolicibacterium sphagni TaxID=1786 RepID=A0A255DF15_9MYCO|nr:hypothetical protein [Mycolicibacterium sphagni]OYN74193.1 hypothetical protein CG716_29340 [Mycolicibacterium sphagni]
MAKRYAATHFPNDRRYSIGNDLKTSGHYLAIPVINGIIEYPEQYWLKPGKYEDFVSDQSAVLKFVEECRAQQHDDQLIFVPSENRGKPL